jgi:hypothetical protein
LFLSDFNNPNQDIDIMSKTQKLQVGLWNKLPQYCVIGDPVNFYVWVNEDGIGEASKWIKGRDAFMVYGKLVIEHKRSKQKFCEHIKNLLAEHKKGK